MIKKVVIPSAGLGTRLLPATKEQPKEILPIFVRNADGKLCLKPLLQIVFENLYDVGFREFGFITGRGKRSVEDHFTIDSDFVDLLKKGNKHEPARELDVFYEKISNSHIAFINQPKPQGIRRCRPSRKTVHRHGTIPSPRRRRSDNLEEKPIPVETYQYLEEHKATAVLCVERVEDPRKYGVIIGRKVAKNLYRVRKIIEKPSKPPSNIAVVAVYAFDSTIYQAIEETPPDMRGEVQLTNAIQKLIDQKHSVYAVELNSRERRLDVGTPESYLEALNLKLRSSNLS